MKMLTIAAAPAPKLLAIMMIAAFICVSSGRSGGGAIDWVVKTGHGHRSGNDATADLEFYVHVDTTGPGIAYLLSPVDSDITASFGQIQGFALNVTSGPDASTSQLLGVMHGYTVQTSYIASVSRAVEVEVLSYDDGAGVNGTISLQGLVTNSGTTIAIVGGSGSFAGVRGYDVISLFNATSATDIVYHHSLYFL